MDRHRGHTYRQRRSHTRRSLSYHRLCQIFPGSRRSASRSWNLGNHQASLQISIHRRQYQTYRASCIPSPGLLCLTWFINMSFRLKHLKKLKNQRRVRNLKKGRNLVHRKKNQNLFRRLRNQNMVFISKFLFTCVAEKPKKSSVGSSPSSTRPATPEVLKTILLLIWFSIRVLTPQPLKKRNHCPKNQHHHPHQNQ